MGKSLPGAKPKGWLVDDNDASPGFAGSQVTRSKPIGSRLGMNPEIRSFAGPPFQAYFKQGLSRQTALLAPCNPHKFTTIRLRVSQMSGESESRQAQIRVLFTPSVEGESPIFDPRLRASVVIGGKAHLISDTLSVTAYFVMCL